ncbi:MAG: hypothetical protein WAM44_04865, partial [Chthoniobacterales bacterium]
DFADMRSEPWSAASLPPPVRYGATGARPMRSAPLEGNRYARREQKILDYPLLEGYSMYLLKIVSP